MLKIYKFSLQATKGPQLNSDPVPDMFESEKELVALIEKNYSLKPFMFAAVRELIVLLEEQCSVEIHNLRDLSNLYRTLQDLLQEFSERFAAYEAITENAALLLS